MNKTDNGAKSSEGTSPQVRYGGSSGGSLLGLYISEIGKYQLLEKAEENYLSRRINQGSNLARKKLILSNLRLVVNIAKGYANQGVNILDLIQEGNIGLMEAVERFDASKGYKFSTYATWWIKQKIRLAFVNEGSTIRVPPHTFDIIRRIKNLKREEREKGNRYLSREEIAGKLNIPIDTVKRAERVQETMVSLDKPIESGQEEVLGDFIEADSPLSAEKEALKAILHDDLEEGLGRLSPRKQKLLRMRYGLDEMEPHTLAEIGEEIGLSRERVRQLEADALEEIADPRFTHHLKRYFARL
ncbi:sigma-70 family RNA polymerase sigma factor [Candidatus Bipolaricaulota bacterium]|nr:sigma-70 family RNA polymerase sigma factor [Candidatus Bipolaricaulota bacterium]